MGVPKAWDPVFGDFMRNLYHYYPKNLDHSSGNPVGVSVCQLSTHGGNRVSASEAYLNPILPNPTIVTDTIITKILIQGKKAVGIETHGKQCNCSQAVSNAAQGKG